MATVITAFKNIIRLKDKYIIFAVISFVGAALLVMTLLLSAASSSFENMLDRPYENYYRVLCFYGDSTDPNESEDIGYHINFFEEYFNSQLAVEEFFTIEVYERRLELAPIDVDGELLRVKKAMFYVTLINDTRYDVGFGTGDRTLIEGKHITGDIPNEMLIDENLALLNGISVGDIITMSGEGDIKEDFTVAGIYRNNKTQNNVDLVKDLDANQVLVSSVTEKKTDRPYTIVKELYFKLADGIDIDEFTDYTLQFTDKYFSDTRFVFMSVYDVSKNSSGGVYTLFRISSVMLGALFIVVIAAELAFSKILISSRTREVLILRALHAPRRRIISQFTFETLFVLLPSALLGAAASAVFGGKLCGELMAYFSSLISPENIKDTSSEFLYKMQDIKVTSAEITPSVLISSIALVAIALIFVTVICVILELRRTNHEPLMTLLSEGRK